MNSSVISEIDCQIASLQQLLSVTKSMKEKVIKVESEKSEVLKKYEDLKVKLERLSNKKCTNCSLLENELRKEKKERENVIKREKTKLVKTIVKSLESLDDGDRNQMTNAHQLLTEIVCGKLNESEEQKQKKIFPHIEEKDSSGDEDGSRIFVNETLVEKENEEAAGVLKEPIVIPETESTERSPPKINRLKVFKDIRLPKFQNINSHLSNENDINVEDKGCIEQASKKLRLSPVLSSSNVSPSKENMMVNQSARSPSVLSEIIEVAGCSSARRSSELSDRQGEKEIAWKMKPSALLEVNADTARGKKLKQMTLSLTRTEKKHDISLSERFKGGVAKHSDDDHDIILPSPEQLSKKTFSKKTRDCDMLEDPDMTVFNPPITSTCLPALTPVAVESSYDRLPQAESPTYKYRRETVRKKAERMRLPGQDCDECARYYAAAGIDQAQVKGWLNQCSRHRDKYQLRAKTPPGFWDPVLPKTPDKSQENL